MRRRTALMIVAGAVVLALVATGGFWWLSRDREPEATAWSKVMAQIEPDGRVGLTMALEGFALAYGPVPGVTPPQGPRSKQLESGSTVAGWVLGHWSELTADQKSAIADYLRIEEAGSGDGQAGGAALAALAPTDFKPLRCNTPKNVVPAVPAQAGWVKVSQESYIPELERRLGRTLDAKLTFCLAQRDAPNLPNHPEDFIDMETVAVIHNDGQLECRITVFPRMAAASDEERRLVLFHELMHCFNRKMAGRGNDTDPLIIPAWVDEGLATWASEDITGFAEPEYWELYFTRPTWSLTSRDYDAVGFFAHLQNYHGRLWEQIPLIVFATSTPSPDLAAFQTAITLDPVGILDTWPSSLLQQPHRGPRTSQGVGAWEVRAAGMGGPIVSAPELRTEEVHNGSAWSSNSNPLGTHLIQMDLQADVVLFNGSGDGGIFGRIGPGPDGDYTMTDAMTRVFCTREDQCGKCPDGPPPEVDFVQLPRAPAWVAFTGGPGQANLEIRGNSIADYCKKPRKPCHATAAPGAPKCDPPGEFPRGAPPAGGPPGGGGGCSVSCAGAHGDPHLSTFDGLFYDLQAVGELVLTKSTSDDFEIQARTAPVPGSDSVSVNTAVAANVAGDRVTVTMRGTEPQLRINGQLAEPGTLPQTLPGGGTARESSGAYEITWLDGSFLRAAPVDVSLNIEVGVGESRRGKLVGPLGDLDGDRANDLVTRDGRAIGEPTFGNLYPEFTDSWRVTAAGSLFDYGPGESTETFTDRAFPKTTPQLDRLPGRAEAEATCQAAGITEPTLLENCILDVAMTGKPVYAAAAARMQNLLTRTVSPGGTARDGDIGGGQITSLTQRDVFHLDLGGASRFHIAEWSGPTEGCDQFLSISLVNITHDHRPCNGGTLTFDAPDPDGRYDIEIASNGSGMGTYSFRLITEKRREFTVRLGDTIGAGQPSGAGLLSARGEVHEFSFDAAGANAIKYSAPPCPDRLVFELRDLTTGDVQLGWRSFCEDSGSIALPDPGHRYAITVGSGSLAAGVSYSFRLDRAP